MIRNAINRLAIGVIALSVVVGGVWVAIEAVALAAGRQTNLMPVDYRSAWRTVQDWNLSTNTVTAIFVLVAVLGLLVLLAEIWPRRAEADVVLVDEPQTTIRFRPGSLTAFVRDRWSELDWVARARPRVRTVNGRVQVSGQPVASRPVSDEEVARANQLTIRDIEAAGIAGAQVQMTKPAAPTTRRVR